MAAPSTAARTTTNYDRFYGTVMEEWDPNFEDVVFEENTWLWFCNQMEKIWKTGGRDYIMNYNSTKNSSAKAFSGMDQLTPPGEEGPSTAVWSMKNYVVSMREIWEESIEHSGDTAMLDIFKQMVENAAASLGETLNDAFKTGTGNGSKHCVGLENAIFYHTHGTAATSTLTRAFSGGTAAFPSMSQTYAGILRSGTDYGATGWRNLSGDLTGDGTFNLASGSMGGFRRAYNLLTRGPRTPDVCFMTLKPFEDFESMHETAYGNVGSTTMIQFQKGMNGDGGTANIPFDTLKWKNMLIVKWEGGTNSGLNSNSADTGDDMIYMLASWTWKLLCETQAWFAMTDWIQGQDQLARVAHLVVRTGGPICINPRYNGVLGEYGE